MSQYDIESTLKYCVQFKFTAGKKKKKKKQDENVKKCNTTAHPERRTFIY